MDFDLEIVVHHGALRRDAEGNWYREALAGEIARERHRLKRGNVDFVGLATSPGDEELILVRDKFEELENYYFGDSMRYNDENFIFDTLSTNMIILIIKYGRLFPSTFDLNDAFQIVDAESTVLNSVEDVYLQVARYVRGGVTIFDFVKAADAFGFEARDLVFVHQLPEATVMDKRAIEQRLREAEIDPVTIFHHQTIDATGDSFLGRDETGTMMWRVTPGAVIGGGGAAAA